MLLLKALRLDVGGVIIMVKGLTRVRLKVVAIELWSWVREVHWSEVCLEIELLKLHLLSVRHLAQGREDLSLMTACIQPTAISCWRPSRILEEREKARSSWTLSSWWGRMRISKHKVALSFEALLTVRCSFYLGLNDFLQIARHLALRTWFITLVTFVYNKSSEPFILHDRVALRSFDGRSEVSEVRKSASFLWTALSKGIFVITLIQNTLYARVSLMIPRWQIAS